MPQNVFQNVSEEKVVSEDNYNDIFKRKNVATP